MKKQTALLVLFLFYLSPMAIGQSDGNYDYTKEFTWGINKNTNGGLIGGAVMKFSRALNDQQFRTIGFEIINVKHPKELKRPSHTGGQFQYGKSNHLFALRGQYGRDFILFKKAPQSGVQINASITAGPTLGIVAPYYVVLGSTGKAEPYTDPSTIDQIQGSGSILDGLSSASILPGLNAKTSISFEMGAFKSNVTGFELGLLMEAYPKEVELMLDHDNRAVYFSAFITLFYGNRK